MSVVSVSSPLRSRLLRLAAPMVLAVVAQSVVNLLFHATVGRFMPPGEYGALGTLLAVVTMIAMPMAALQAAASALAASQPLSRTACYSVLARVAAWTTLASVGLVALSPAVADFFHLPSVADAALLAAFLLVAAPLAAARGLLLGRSETKTVAWGYLLGAGVRLAAGVPAAFLLGVIGAMLGTLLGELAALCHAMMALRRVPSGTGAPVRTAGRPAAAPAHRLGLRAVALSGLTVTGLFVFSTVDLLLARHYLAAESLAGDASGGYVAAATVAKTLLAVPAAIVAAVFPRLVAAWRTAQQRGTFSVAVGITAVPGMLAAGIVLIAPGLVLAVLYGDVYRDETAVARVLVLTAAGTGLVTILAHAALARRSAAVMVPWLGAAVEVALIVAVHSDAMSIAWVSLVSLVPSVGALLWVEGRAWLSAPPSSLPSSVTASRSVRASQPASDVMPAVGPAARPVDGPVDVPDDVPAGIPAGVPAAMLGGRGNSA